MSTPLRSTCVYLNINGRYDRPKISHELQVNVPRTMGILRDEIVKVGFISTLHFRKFKVALNPTYRIFLNFAKRCVLLSNVDNMKKNSPWCFNL